MSNSGYAVELANERDYIEFLYRKLDRESETTVRKMPDVLLDRGLCFGRADDSTGTTTYIGRLGLFDTADDYRPLLLDWRAPAARPFYRATAGRPDGLVRRRHFRTSGRTITGFHDDRLVDGVDTAPMAAPMAARMAELMAALSAPRGDTMRDIVATIQAEQDEIIRLDRHGIVVIEGGPGTGKTAVALHRAAYLRYTVPERCDVLVIGPNSRFLRYIGDVLPSLGETDVAFATPGTMFPGVRTAVQDTPAARRIKGGLAMVDVLAAAVADRQRVPDTPIPIRLADVEITVDTALAGAARHRARATGLPHNPARAVFTDELIDGLAGRAVDRIGDGWLDRRDVRTRARLAADVRLELAEHQGLHRAIGQLWPTLTPQRLLADLFAARTRLAAVLPAGDALYRADGAAWTVSDVPLLDEAAELLGGVERPTYGHVVVDEAQELSEMDWRSVVRRCPSRSMTVVGDLARRDSPAGARSWSEMLDRYAPGRWRHRELTVNYRTPAEIMAVLGASAPRSVRSTGVRPWARRVRPVDLSDEITALGRAWDGTIAVIGAGGITPTAAKGLEFDNVVVVEPAHILAEHGTAGLTVALTRATQRLAVLHSEPLPSCLVSLC